MKNVMIDLETLSTTMNAGILSIAAVEFDPKNGEIGAIFHENISIQSLIDEGYSIQGSTLEWWLNQDKEAIQSILNEPMHINVVLQMLTRWLYEISEGQLDEIFVWGNGAKFDLGILSNAYEKKDKMIPWKHYNEFCLRTIAALFPEIKEEANSQFFGVKHNPKDDCLNQIAYLTKTLNRKN